MDPGGLRRPLSPSLPGNCDCEGDHLRRLSEGWNPVPEGDILILIYELPTSIYSLAFMLHCYVNYKSRVEGTFSTHQGTWGSNLTY